LLDTYADGKHGGTGMAFDWNIARDAKRFGRIILSGGLTPENIQAAILHVWPYAVDVNSGVERSPGIKDKKKIQQLLNVIGKLQSNSHQEPVC